VSFHKYGDNFFPGTGASGDVGYAKGAGYSINVPLKDGMDDESYKFIFEPVMKKVLDVRNTTLSFSLAVFQMFHLECVACSIPWFSSSLGAKTQVCFHERTVDLNGDSGGVCE
jgi:hypothetical protein